MNTLKKIGIGLGIFITMLAMMFIPGTKVSEDPKIAELDRHITALAEEMEMLQTQSDAVLGASSNAPSDIALFSTSLAAGISTTDTSMTLSSATYNSGASTLASSTYLFVIGQGSPTEELVLADCTGVTCTNITRGIDRLTGTSTVTALKKDHRRGDSVKITTASLVIHANMLRGVQNIENRLRYSSNIATSTFETYDLINKSYVDSVAIAGGVPGSTSLAGLFKLATQLQAASSTAGDGTYSYVLPSSMATDTPNTATRASRVIMSDLTGYIKQAWLGLGYTFPMSDGTSGQTLTTNGSGVLSFSTPTTSAVNTSKTYTASATIIAGWPVSATSTGNDTFILDTGGVSGGPDPSGRVSPNRNYHAQSFTEASAITFDSISAFIGTGGTPTDNMVITIETDNGGVPSGSSIATSSILGTRLAGATASTTMVFDRVVTTSPATKYWVVWKRSGAYSDVNYYTIGIPNSNSYANGSCFYNVTGVWTDLAIDCTVKLMRSNKTIEVYPGNASNANYSGFIGIAENDAVSGGSVTVSTAGEADSMWGLIPGRGYYLGNATGTVSEYAGTNSRKIGVATGSSTMVITNSW